MIAALLFLIAQDPIAVPCAKGSREPQLSVAADGQVALVWGKDGELSCCCGDPRDQAKFLRVLHITEKLNYSIGMRRGPRVALLPGDRFVLTAIGGEKGGGKDGDLLSWRHFPETLDWHQPQRVNSVAGSAREGLHALARGPRGELYCAWIDLRGGKPCIYGALSLDSARTWVREMRISKDQEICPCCAPSVAFDETGAVHVMWRGVALGARDMQVASSSDGGLNFSAAQKLGSGTWKLDACPMDGGALAPAADGKMLTVWRRERQVFQASDASAETLVGAGEQPWIAGSTIVWLEKRGGKLFTLALGAKEPQTLAEDANDPVVAASPDGKSMLYAAWETGSGDATEIRLERLR